MAGRAEDISVNNNIPRNPMNRKMLEVQNQSQYESYIEKGPVTFGPWTSASFRNDPKRFCFVLARYKFCAKMLQGKSRVFEIGCGDGPGVPLILQSVNHVFGLDIEPAIIEDT